MKQAIDIAERLRRYGDVDAFDELCRVYEQLEAEWVGLTDAEIDKEYDNEGYVGVAFADGSTGIALDRQAARDFARAIEAKLREKNT